MNAVSMTSKSGAILCKIMLTSDPKNALFTLVV